MLAGLTALVFAALAISGADTLHIRRDSTPMSLPFVRRVNMTGVPSIVKQDQARAKALKANRADTRGFRQAAVFDVPATNQAVDYTTTVITLLIDTGSSNTWVGAQLNNPFVGSGTTKSTGQLVASMSRIAFDGSTEVIDTVTLSNGLAIENQSFGSALVSQGFDGVDGIIGIGPVDLTCGTLLPAINQCIPTVTDNAFSQGLISAHEIGISFEPTTTLGNTNGELTFGGVDTTKFTGTLNFVPITSTSPANEFVGIDQSITYGAADGTTVLAATSGITDTGTTLLLLATDAFDTYQALAGAVLDSTTGLLRLTSDQFDSLQSLLFHIGDSTLEFTPNAQAWPRALNSAIGGTSDFVYLIVNDLGSLSGEGLDFIDGMTFLERFYYVFDIANSQVGFATTAFTDATTN
ncbi:family A1 protease [Epithele typhae]|uniref:family A1 protease n=1 Tax=Epithele typhae TaxID=378194 RepID=UPI0020079646|nr:family A1 protease [Epithele typhae]KAH9934559.1 family A1 protease [Epithele typhae]